MDDIEQWIKREYPDGQIDWRAEYARLLAVMEQALPMVDSGAAKSLCETAVKCGKRMLEDYVPGDCLDTDDPRW